MSWLSGIFSWFSSLFGGGTRPDSNVVVAIQAMAVKLCSFLPTAETVITLISVSSPAVAAPATVVVNIAKQICKIVTEMPATPAATVLTLTSPEPVTVQSWQVGDIVITGSFVKK